MQEKSNIHDNKNPISSKLSSCLFSKFAIALIFLFLGVATTLAVQNFTAKPQKQEHVASSQYNQTLEEVFDNLYYKTLSDINYMNKRMQERFDYIDHYFENINTVRNTKKTYASYKEDNDFAYYQINFEGYNVEEVSVNIEGRNLVISASKEQKEESEEKKSKVYSNSNFLYSFTIPNNVDSKDPEITKESNKILIKLKKINN